MSPTVRHHLLRPAVILAWLMTVATGSVTAQTAGGPADQSSFDEVTAQLDKGGNAFVYVSTAGFSNKLETFLKTLDPTLKEIISRQQAKAQEKEYAKALVNIIHQAYKESGLGEISGYGASSYEFKPGMYRNKSFLHHYPQDNQGKLWQMFGGEPHALETINMMPANTAVVAFYDLDMDMLWKWQKELVLNCGSPSLVMKYKQTLQFLQQVMSLETMVQSIDGQVGFVLTLNPDRMVTLPIQKEQVRFPEPAFAMVAKTKTPAIQNFLTATLKQKLEPMNMQPQKATFQGEEITTVPMPLPLPFTVKIAMATVNDYFVLATNPALIENMIAARNGEADGLDDTPGFQEMTAGLELRGNAYGYVSSSFMESIQAFQTLGRSKLDPALRKLLAVVQELQAVEDTDAFGLMRVRPDGIVGVGHSRQGWAEMVGTQLIAVPATLITTIAGPKLLKAQKEAKRAGTKANLKQIGLACLMYAGENNGNFPAPDGYAGLTELSKSDILQVGPVYLSPADQKRQEQPNAKALTAENCSYIYVGAGYKDDDRFASITPLAFEDPDLGGGAINVLFIDGHVETLSGAFKSCRDVIEALHRKYKYNQRRHTSLLNKAKKLDQ